MGISKQLFMETFERQYYEDELYIAAKRAEDESYWKAQIAREEWLKQNKPRTFIKINTNGKFKKKTRTRLFKKVQKGYEKSSSTENNEKVLRTVGKI